MRGENLITTFGVLPYLPRTNNGANVARLIRTHNKINKNMTTLEGKAAYINELAKLTKFLPTKYFADVQEMLPEKSLHRIKNARAGIVQDQDVLKALKKIAEKERQRRIKAAQKQLKAAQQA